MTKGPGRSDCYRVGVTYGYRECLRVGRVRAGKKLRRKFAGPSWFDGLALSFKSNETLLASVQLIPTLPTLRVKALRRVSWRPYIDKEPF